MSERPKLHYPGPSAEERELQQKQLALIEASEAREKAWEPMLMGEMGYKYGEEGAIEKLPYEEMAPEMQRSYDIAQLAEERELKALRGELEIDPSVERQLEEDERTLRNQLYRDLGQGYELSTPGQKALQDFRESAQALRYAISRGEMTSSEALSQSRWEGLQRRQLSALEGTREPTSRQLGIASAYGQPLSYYERLRQQKAREKEINYQARLEKQRSIMGNVQKGFWTAMSSLSSGLSGGLGGGLGGMFGGGGGGR